MTQFQIEGGSMMQGVTKLIMTFSTFLTQKHKYADPVEKKWS